MKEVYCYQEVESEIAQGETVALTAHPTLLVRAAKHDPASEAITVTYELCIGSGSIGVFTSEFPIWKACWVPSTSPIMRKSGKWWGSRDI